MLPAGFEPAIPATEQPQTHALDRATTRISCFDITYIKSYVFWSLRPGVLRPFLWRFISFVEKNIFVI